MVPRFPFAMGHHPVRYLGLPLLTKCMSAVDYQPLLDKICTRISSWTTHFLSFAGRIQLINFVLVSIVNSWTAAFRLHSACIREVENSLSAFLWSGPTLNPKKSKIAWTEVSKSKQEGGLGIRPLKEVNVICCLKLIWRITSTQPSLWVKWVKTNLIKQGSLWSVRENASIGSWMWRKLLKYRNIAKGLHRVEVKNCRRTSFWFDV